MVRVHGSANFSPYLPDNAGEKLRSYVYHGIDHSYYYQKIQKPLCAKVVQWLPYWLAPNTITVGALGLVIITHLLLAYFFPDLTPPPLLNSTDNNTMIDYHAVCPSWIFALAGVGMLLYQFLDNIDGHQARRLGVSSPLGLLMDHGCDAFNCVVGGLTFCTALGCGPTWKTWCGVMSPCVVFVMNTWEEYYRGTLVLPVINGPNEGILVAAGVYFFTAFNALGIYFWTENSVTIPASSLPLWARKESVLPFLAEARIPVESFFSSYASWFSTDPTAVTTMLRNAATPHRNVYPFSCLVPEKLAALVEENLYSGPSGNVEIQYNTLVIGLMTISAVFTCFGNIIQVYLAIRRSSGEAMEKHGRYGNGWLLRRLPFVHSLTRLLPLGVLLVLANLWFYLSPNSIFVAHPRLFIWSIGLLFTKNDIHLMIAHLCSVEFHPFRRTLVPFFYLSLHVMFTYVRRHAFPDFDEETILYEFFLLSAVTFAHLVINAVNETADALKVPVFTVPKAKQVAAAARDAELLKANAAAKTRKQQ